MFNFPNPSLINRILSSPARFDLLQFWLGANIACSQAVPPPSVDSEWITP